MPTVQIPKDYFLKESRQEYNSLSERLVIELISNSLDAGAKDIKFKFDEDGYSCEDSGSGMSEEVLISGMLTLGGSKKDNPNSVGQFGAAKTLEIFSHESYEIHTRDIRARGFLLDYELESAPFLSGTRISAKYIKENKDFPAVRMIQRVKEFCNKSFLNDINITVNGEKITEKADLGAFQKEFLALDGSKIGDIYSKKGENSYYVNVLCNGLFMYSQFIGEISEKITVNILIPSKVAFAQSRDSLRDEAAKAFQLLIKEVSQETETWHKVRKPVEVLKGHKTYWDNLVSKISNILNKPEEIIKDVLAKNSLDAILAALMDMAPDDEKKKEIQEISNLAVQNVDFYIDRADYQGEIETFHPKTGLKRSRMLAALWKAMILDIGQSLEIEFTFALGWTFDQDTLAAYKKQDGVDVFFVNPTKPEYIEGDMKSRFCALYSAAQHEVCHLLQVSRGYDLGHNQSFANLITMINTATLKNTKGYVAIMNKAKEYQNEL